MTEELKEAIEVLKTYMEVRRNAFPKNAPDVIREAIDTVVSVLEKPLPKGIRLHECPVCKQKAGKTYLASRLPTICQNCDHIWLRG